MAYPNCLVGMTLKPSVWGSCQSDSWPCKGGGGALAQLGGRRGGGNHHSEDVLQQYVSSVFFRARWVVGGHWQGARWRAPGGGGSFPSSQRRGLQLGLSYGSTLCHLGHRP